MHERDRQTDRQTDIHRITACCACLASRGKILALIIAVKRSVCLTDGRRRTVDVETLYQCRSMQQWVPLSTQCRVDSVRSTSTSRNVHVCSHATAALSLVRLDVWGCPRRRNLLDNHHRPVQNAFSSRRPPQFRTLDDDHDSTTADLAWNSNCFQNNYTSSA